MFLKVTISHTIVLLLVIGITVAGSQNSQSITKKRFGTRPPANLGASTSESERSVEPTVSGVTANTSVTHLTALESKPKARYAGHHGDQYILHDDEYDHGGDGGKDYVVASDHEDHDEHDHHKGYHNVNNKVADENNKNFHAKGAFKDSAEGGSTFDKHHKDRVAENKENEDVNEHDAGEKFGSEALTEHKLGKHKEKSKGHKKHGFKNVYHKEEYGEHKTFHDEFLDNDHHHEYDDHHENRQLQGGKFSKGYKREGENKEFDEGDENHAWSKKGHDGHQEGDYEKGGHLSKNHHGHKQQEGHYEANGQSGKHTAHKVKKGKAPEHEPHHGVHHGGDHPHYYARSHNYHDNKGPDNKGPSSPSLSHTVNPARYHYHNIKSPEPIAYDDEDEEDFPHQEARLPYVESRDSPKHAKHKYRSHDQSAVNDQGDGQRDTPSKQHIAFNDQPESVLEQFQPKKYTARKNHEPRGHFHRHFLIRPHKEPVRDHHRSAVLPNPDDQTSAYSDKDPNKYDAKNNHYGHSGSQPYHPSERPHARNPHHYSSYEKSKPYSWRDHSRNFNRHHHPDDISRSPSYHHFGYANAPRHFNR